MANVHKGPPVISVCLTLLALVFLGLLTVTPASATSVGCGHDIWSPAASGITANWDQYDGMGAVNLGDVFVSNTTGVVCALGIYAGNDATYINPETVGLYSGGFGDIGTLLTSTTVTDTDPYYDGYYWAPTAPVTITAGDTYTVVDFLDQNGWGYGPPPITHGVTFVQNDYLYTGSLAFPTMEGGSGPAYYGGDVMLTPEPDSLLLLGSGLIGLAGLLRRKFRRN